MDDRPRRSIATGDFQSHGLRLPGQQSKIVVRSESIRHRQTVAAKQQHFVEESNLARTILQSNIEIQILRIRTPHQTGTHIRLRHLLQRLEPRSTRPRKSPRLKLIGRTPIEVGRQQPARLIPQLQRNKMHGSNLLERQTHHIASNPIGRNIHTMDRPGRNLLAVDVIDPGNNAQLGKRSKPVVIHRHGIFQIIELHVHGLQGMHSMVESRSRNQIPIPHVVLDHGDGAGVAPEKGAGTVAVAIP